MNIWQQNYPMRMRVFTWRFLNLGFYESINCGNQSKHEFQALGEATCFKDPENISVVDIASKYYSAYNAGVTDYKMSIARGE
jgi:hypothetical protein